MYLTRYIRSALPWGARKMLNLNCRFVSQPLDAVPALLKYFFLLASTHTICRHAFKSSYFFPLPVLPPASGANSSLAPVFKKAGNRVLPLASFVHQEWCLYRTERSLYRYFGTNWFAPKKISGRGESAFGAGWERGETALKISSLSGKL